MLLGQLRLCDNSVLQLHSGAAVKLGRAHISVTGSASLEVSRVQCEVLCQPGSELEARVTSLGTINPTLVRKSADGERWSDIWLQQGQSELIAMGDRIALRHAAPEEYIQFEPPGVVAMGVATLRQQATPRQHAEADFADAPPTKRAKPSQAPAACVPLDSSRTATAAPAAVDAPAQLPRMVLILCGPPGSGKSTFCQQLAALSASSWVRVNQDTAGKNGKKGTRAQCVAAAIKALQAGSCVLVDRCNFDVQQRADFVALAQQLGAQAHALVFKLPVALCAQRAQQRINHEGGVEGPRAAPLVYQISALAEKAGLPTRAEGLFSMMVCQSDAEVQRALQAWAAYGTLPGDAAPAWQARKHALFQGGGVYHGAGPTLEQQQQQQKLQHLRQQLQMERLASSGQPAAGATRLGMQVPGQGVASQEALNQRLPQNSLQEQTRAQPMTQTGLTLATCMRAQQHRPLSVPSTAGVAGGSASDAVNLSSPDPAQNGQRSAGVVNLISPPSSSAGSTPEQQQAQPVTASNTSQTPAADTACLRGSVIELAACDSQPATATWGTAAAGRAPAAALGSSPPARNAFALMMQAASPSPSKALASPAQPAAKPAPAGNIKGTFGGGWQDVLRKVAMEPERHSSKFPGMVVGEQCVLINDAYPKAKCHGLVIARDPELDGPDQLRTEHLALLQRMQDVGERWAAEQKAANPALEPFKLGFHAIPSMRQLHLHVISQDFESACLKHKKHWNSFTTAFFRPISAVREELEREGRLALDKAVAEQLLKADLRCHRCRAACKTMPALKAHTSACKVPLQS